jgi:hypothetical protein
MTRINPGRFTAELGDRKEVVVFIIGMRINRLLQVWRWMPVLAAMPKMIVELSRDPSLGLLAQPRTFLSGRVILLVQYWRSFEELERFARDPQRSHLGAWRDFNRRIRNNGSVGIFHETYRAPAEAIETVYANMPAFGLAGATACVPVGKGRHSAAARLGVRPDGDPPVEPY